MEHFSEDSALSVVYHRLLFAMVTIFTEISVAWLQTKDQSLLLKSWRKSLCDSRLNLETHSNITNDFVKLCGHFWQFRVRKNKFASFSNIFSSSWNWNLVVFFDHLICFLGEISSPVFQPCSSGPLKTGFWELALSVQLQNGQWSSLQHVLTGTPETQRRDDRFLSDSASVFRGAKLLVLAPGRSSETKGPNP